MKYYKFFYAALAVILATSAHAQQAESCTYRVINTFDSSLSASSDFEMKQGDTSYGDLSVASAEFSTGVKMRNDEGLSHSFSLNYSGIYFDIENEAALPLPDDLNSFELNYMGTMPLDEEWTLLGSISGVWNGSGTSFDSDGLGIGVWLGAMYVLDENTNFVFGVVYNSLGDHHFIPGVGVEWKMDDQWILSVGFPKTAITYVAQDNLRYSLLVEGHFGAYYVDAEDLNKDLRHYGDTELEYEDYRIALEADWDVDKNISLTGKIGCIIESKLDYYKRSYEIESDEGALYMELGLRTRF